MSELSRVAAGSGRALPWKTKKGVSCLVEVVAGGTRASVGQAGQAEGLPVAHMYLCLVFVVFVFCFVYKAGSFHGPLWNSFPVNSTVPSHHQPSPVNLTAARSKLASVTGPAGACFCF